ncbi:FG-GAP-like repeat-containing protein [Streptomyces luteireticuli]|uniref:FG-GAP-like repeat-containing protein n=1 Tax=Streptomyces luteireticuli TaxID=173858 RepID=UPI00355631FA
MFGRGSRPIWAAGVLTTVVATGALVAAPAHAVVGDEVKDGQYQFTVKLDIGDGKRSCTGAVIDERWVLTAASCFADGTGDASKVAAGAPKENTLVTAAGGGRGSKVVRLVPHKDRDLVMALLQSGLGSTATPVTVGTNAPAQGEELLGSGFGRTKDQWVPGKAHSGVFTVDAVKDGAFDATGKNGAGMCKGDAGSPLFREKGGTFELVGVNHASWQGGCLGTVNESRTGTVNTRVDDVNSWIQQTRVISKAGMVKENFLTTADFNGDGRTDVAAIHYDGTLHAYYTSADGTLEYGRPLWNDDSWKSYKKIVGGDFNGDGKGDIIALGGDDNLYLYLGDNKGNLAPRKKIWNDSSWATMQHIARYKADDSGRDGLIAVWGNGALFSYTTGPDGTLTGQKREMWRDRTWGGTKHLTTGDFNGDGKDDIAMAAYDGQLRLYPGNGKGSFDDARDMWRDKSWGSMWAVMGGDFNGDGKADLIGRWAPDNLSASERAKEAATDATQAAMGLPARAYEMRWYGGDGKGALGDGRSVWPAGVVLRK